MIKRYTIGKLLYAVDDDRLRIYEGIIVGIKTRDHILVKTDKCNVIFEYDLLIDFKYSEKQVLIKTFMEHSVHESKIAALRNLHEELRYKNDELNYDFERYGII